MNERPSPEIKLERESPSKGSSYKKEASAVVSQASSGQAVGRALSGCLSLACDLLGYEMEECPRWKTYFL